ncbi:uncharacterized protein LOC111831654 [Capsella rubella]|uniref:uncharacterized protein LOC111831654 n=1 Tax=Capsella rubella TaxID=81985 RepID=UPI000CD50DC2|nr:uncharacterized protein LOC111831654 [Capsella rubella]
MNASFWYDSWSPLGTLIKALGHEGPRSLRVPLLAKVAHATNPHGWVISDPRSDLALSLHMYLTTIPLPRVDLGPDSYDWVVDDQICNGFSSTRTWSSIRPKASKVPWHQTVWFKGATPRNAFNMWVANLDRLPTKTRLSNWGMNIDITCSLCDSLPESRDHLFLSCDFALFLWNAVSRRIRSTGLAFNSWPEMLAWTNQSNHDSPPTLRKLIVQSVLYAIWKQRNNAVHNQVHLPPSVIFKEIDREIKNSISARIINKKIKHLMSRWI